MGASSLDELIAEAELGEEARRFVESGLGRCLIGMARQEVTAAQEDLLKADPMKPNDIRKLQNKAELGLKFEQWLCELIQKGDNALEVYNYESKDRTGG